MASRYTHRQLDGDESDPTSALEMAVDSHWCVSCVYVITFLVEIWHTYISSIFLSSDESQKGSLFLSCFRILANYPSPVVNSLWSGDLVQKMDEKFNVDCKARSSPQYLIFTFVTDAPYSESQSGGFLSHVDPSRLCVPRYQNFFRVAVWLFFLIVYSQAGRLESLLVNIELIISF